MENVSDVAQVSVILYVIYAAGASLHIVAAQRWDYFKHRMVAWALLWPIVTPIWLLSWPARRLLRWRRNRRNLKRLTLDGWADIFKITMPHVPRQNFVFTDANGGGKWVDAPKQPEKRAEETMTAHRIRTAPGEPVSPEVAARIAKMHETLANYIAKEAGGDLAGAAFTQKPPADSFPNIPWAEYPLQNRVINADADSSPDLPPYGGSKPSEDARPAKQADVDELREWLGKVSLQTQSLQADTQDLVDLRSRLAALEDQMATVLQKAAAREAKREKQ